jgi:hypothetical protein
MKWYAAHIVMMVEVQGAESDHVPVWENIVLVKAATEADAFQQAEDVGREAAGDDDGTFRWGKRPATWIFAGVRKLTECALFGEVPGPGDEIASTEYRFETKGDVKRFVEGKSVATVVDDRYRVSGREEVEEAPETKRRARRRPA